MKHWFTIIFLSLSGLLLMVIGASILIVPKAFYAMNGITLGNDPSMLSEIRAPGGLFVVISIFILLGVLRSRHRPLAMLLTLITFGSIGISRLFSMVMDGMPVRGLVEATVIELVVAAIALFCMKCSSSKYMERIPCASNPSHSTN